jgi:hypothetical protein
MHNQLCTYRLLCSTHSWECAADLSTAVSHRTAVSHTMSGQQAVQNAENQNQYDAGSVGWDVAEEMSVCT